MRISEAFGASQTARVTKLTPYGADFRAFGPNVNTAALARAAMPKLNTAALAMPKLNTAALALAAMPKLNTAALAMPKLNTAALALAAMPKLNTAALAGMPQFNAATLAALTARVNTAALALAAMPKLNTAALAEEIAGGQTFSATESIVAQLQHLLNEFQDIKSLLNSSAPDFPEASQVTPAPPPSMASEPWRQRHMNDLMLTLTALAVLIALTTAAITVAAWLDPRSSTTIVREPVNIDQMIRSALQACPTKKPREAPRPGRTNAP
jgi:hypothetical protein